MKNTPSGLMMRRISLSMVRTSCRCSITSSKVITSNDSSGNAADSSAPVFTFNPNFSRANSPNTATVLHLRPPTASAYGAKRIHNVSHPKIFLLAGDAQCVEMTAIERVAVMRFAPSKDRPILFPYRRETLPNNFSESRGRGISRRVNHTLRISQWRVKTRW